MQFIGILKEYEDGPIKIGKSITDVPIVNSELENLPLILLYLQGGAILMAFLHWVSDLDNNPIGPLIFYTDGKWIWASYLGYYLSKGYHSLLSEEFISDMQKNNFRVPIVAQAEIEEVEKFYVAIYDLRRKK